MRREALRGEAYVGGLWVLRDYWSAEEAGKLAFGAEGAGAGWAGGLGVTEIGSMRDDWRGLCGVMVGVIGEKSLRGKMRWCGGWCCPVATWYRPVGDIY